MPSDPGLQVVDATAGYDGRSVLHTVSFALHRGDATAIIGPNGVGKTTLLKLLAGSLRPQSGHVSLDGLPLTAIPRRELAKSIAVVPQKLDIGFGLCGREVVALGRTPYVGFFGSQTRADHEAIDRAIAETDTASFVDRPYSSLSGGESQRVVLAMALAQETPYLLLDEPTVHLDLGQQWRLIERLMGMRRSRNVGILAILHDLTLAGLGFDRVVLIGDGRIVADGSPAEVLTESNISEGFGAPVTVWHDVSGVRVALIPSSPP